MFMYLNLTDIFFFYFLKRKQGKSNLNFIFKTRHAHNVYYIHNIIWSKMPTDINTIHSYFLSIRKVWLSFIFEFHTCGSWAIEEKWFEWARKKTCKNSQTNKKKHSHINTVTVFAVWQFKIATVSSDCE